jgi:HlyD family secretion protein
MFRLWLQYFLFCIVFFLSNLFVQGINFSEAAKSDPDNQKTKKTFPVAVGEIQNFSKVEKIKLPGTVIPWSITSLAAEIDSRVDTIYVNEGDFVKKDDLLIQLRIRPLELELELAKAQKKRIYNKLEELLTGTREEVLAASQASVRQTYARLRLTWNEFKRIKKLYEEGVLSLNDYDNAKALAQEARARFHEKKSQWQEFKMGPRIEKINQEKASLVAAEARIKIIEDQIDRAGILAPFDGFVIKKETEVGQWLEKGDPGLTMIVINPAKIEVNLPQFYFDRIQNKASATVILESRDLNQADLKLQGEVVEKIYSGDQTSRTFPIRIKVDNPNAEIAMGMSVQVELRPAKKQPNRFYVPKDALVRTPNDVFIWVIRSKNGNDLTAEKVQVEPGRRVNSMVAITAKNSDVFKIGDKVVVQGNERLRPNSKVSIIQSTP